MLQSVIHRVRDALHHTISHYVSRLIVAVPVVIAVAFATAAAATELSSRFGATYAYLILAIVFAVVALIAAAVMASREQPGADTSTASTPQSDGVASSSDSDGPHLQFDPAMLLVAGRLAGPAAASVRTLLRNWPLVIGALVLAWLLLSETPEKQEPAVAEPAE